MTEDLSLRELTVHDVGAVVELLQVCFDGWRARGPEADQFFRWKHFDNPFGASTITVATEGDQGSIVGFHALMHWRLRDGDDPIPVVRGADAAIHPDWRRRGLWTRLVDQNLERVRQPAAVFLAHGNPASQGGYRRRGWNPNVLTRLWGRPIRPRILAGRRPSPVAASDLADERWSEFARQQDVERVEGDLIATDYSADYLRWRYASIPGLHYQVWTPDDRSEAWAIGFLRSRKQVHDWRISDGDPDRSGFHASRENDAAPVPRLLTVLGGTPRLKRSALLSMGFVPLPGRTVPVITLPLDTGGAFEHQRWAPTLGDLESIF